MEKDERKREKAYVGDDAGIAGPTCLICWDNSKNPLVMHCCSKTFCQKCVIEALRLRQTCPSCEKRYASDDVTELAKPLFVPEPVETALQFESSHKNIDVKEFGNNFRDIDESTITKLIEELSHVRAEKYKERKNENMRITSLGLNDFIKKCKYEVVAINRQMEAAIQGDREGRMSDNNRRQRLQLGKKCSECGKPLTDVEGKKNAWLMCFRCFAKQRCVPQEEATEYSLPGPPAFPPSCQKCNKVPRQPHAVNCCGAMYCQECLMMIMSEAQQKGEQPYCINPQCQKAMGDAPPPKMRRSQQTAEASRQPEQRTKPTRLAIGEPQPKMARIASPEYPNPPPDPVYDISLCPICLDNVNDPVEMKKCCRRLFCRKCIVEALKLLPLCLSCNAKYSLGEVADLINSFSDSLSELVDKTRKNEESLHISRTELISVLYLGLDDIQKNAEQKIEENRRQIDRIFLDKQIINGEVTASTSRQDSSPSASVANRADRLHRTWLAYSRVKQHFNAFSKKWKETSNRYDINTSGITSYPYNRINDLLAFINETTRYGNICRNGILHCPLDPETSQPVISSLDFDSKGRRFLVTGSTRKIKIFDYQQLLDSPIKHHDHTTLCQYPTNVLQWKNKDEVDITVSCAAWSPSEENKLVSGGHGGKVAVWDVNTNSIVKTLDETGPDSTGRCCAIKFNNEDSELVASASYDGTVKLWNIKCGYVAQIQNRSCIYCVDFSPTNKNHLVFGSGDQGVHLYDIRRVNDPVAKLGGDIGAVSHVRYINSNEVVSASLDGSLRVWNITERKCTKTLSGHVNKSKFVGLSGAGDYIICGSENNHAFVYFKDLSEPLGSYSMGSDSMSSSTIPYVSSVCWKKGTNYALVANSIGKIHLVEMS